MPKLTITNKRKQISYINISYNSLAPWDAYKSDYVFSMDNIYSGGYCSNFRVETLPHKGQLFKGLHDGQSYYIKLNVGDFISFDNIVEETMLRFKAEGFEDNQFTGNYTTLFQLRCVDTNELITVNINATDIRQAPSQPVSQPIQGVSFNGESTFSCVLDHTDDAAVICECFYNFSFNISELARNKTGLIKFVRSEPSYYLLQINGEHITNEGFIFPIDSSVSISNSYKTNADSAYGPCTGHDASTLFFRHSVDNGVTWGEEFSVGSSADNYNH